MGRRWMIFCSYLIIEICLLGSLIANLNHGKETEATLTILYHLCKFSAHFGFIFLMLITVELFPTSLRCTGLGICFIFKMIGSAISSPNLVKFIIYQLYCCFSTVALLGFIVVDELQYQGASIDILPIDAVFRIDDSFLARNENVSLA